MNNERKKEKKSEIENRNHNRNKIIRSFFEATIKWKLNLKLSEKFSTYLVILEIDKRIGSGDLIIFNLLRFSR